MTLPVFRRFPELREYLQRVRSRRRSIGLVATMGALHAGHSALIETARRECDCVVVSIFVNPLQFGPNEDFSRYPRAFQSDLSLSTAAGAEVIFAPEVQDMYPEPPLTFVEVTRVSENLCGAFRPGHFRGVATVVLKLFNIAQPDRAYFGEKDFQQLAVIRRLVQDLDLPLTVVGIPTVREPDGLALSSRNRYLKPEERRTAPVLFQSLLLARRLVEGGETNAGKITDAAIQMLSQSPGVRVQYFEIVDPNLIEPVAVIDRPVRIAAAIFMGSTRLIDNIPASGTSD